MPFILRYLEYKDKEIANIVIQMLHLEEYVKTIEKQEIQYYHLLKEHKLMNALIEEVGNFSDIAKKLLSTKITV